MPGTNLIVAEHALRAAQGLRRVRARIAVNVLIGLAVSGWIGFLVLTGVLVAMRSSARPGFESGAQEVEQAAAAMAEASQNLVTGYQVGPEAAAAAIPATLPYGLTSYEERRRIQEWMRQADAVEHEYGNVSAARSIYDHAADKGWAPAALALALSYDPQELQRRNVVMFASDPAKARACYLKARDLMEAAVAFYLSRLPPGGGGKRC